MSARARSRAVSLPLHALRMTATPRCRACPIRSSSKAYGTVLPTQLAIQKLIPGDNFVDWHHLLFREPLLVKNVCDDCARFHITNVWLDIGEYVWVTSNP